MSLARFDFPYHTTEDRYPENSVIVQFGKSWEFASKPKGPPQVQFRLEFKHMWWFLDGNENVLTDVNTQINIATLRQFYEAHELYEKFIYPHPARGDVTVRFAQPLVVPKSIENGNGATDPFEVVLKLQP